MSISGTWKSRYSRRAAEHGRREEYPEVIFFLGGKVNMTPLGEVCVFFFLNLLCQLGIPRFGHPHPQMVCFRYKMFEGVGVHMFLIQPHFFDGLNPAGRTRIWF